MSNETGADGMAQVQPGPLKALTKRMAVIECYQSQAVKVAADGQDLDEDFDRTERIWSRLGKSRETH